LEFAVLGYRTDLEANPIIESASERAAMGREMCRIVEIGDIPRNSDRRPRNTTMTTIARN